jgi:hypothetical protein
MFRKINHWVLLAVAIIMSSPALSYAADIDTLFTAIDISTVSGKVTTVLVAMIGISLVFVGYRYAKKALGR